MGKNRKRPFLCPICDELEEPNKEDVLPRWLREEQTRLGTQQVSGTFLRIGKRCNSELGRKLEQPASSLIKPMLGGTPQTLDPDHQELVAKWVVKTAALYALRDVQNPNAGPSNLAERALAKSLVRNLLDDGQLPATCRVHLGRFDAALEPRPDERSYFTPEKVPHIQFHANAQFGSLVYDVVVAHPDAFMLAYDQHREAQGNAAWLTRVWPVQRPEVAWPPTEAFGFFEIWKWEALRAASAAQAAGKPGWVPKPVQYLNFSRAQNKELARTFYESVRRDVRES